MPAEEQALASAVMHRSETFTAPSFTTVDCMLAVVTHTGVKSTDGTLALAPLSWVVPLTRSDGGVFPANTSRTISRTDRPASFFL